MVGHRTRFAAQTESVALLHSLSDWLVEQKLRVLPKSPLGQAISNALANWQALCRHPEDGELSIDNILSERALWAQAVGRNNWLFVGSDDGGRTATVLFSITASASDTASTPSATWRTVFGGFPPLRPTGELDCCPMSGFRRTQTQPENEPHSLKLDYQEGDNCGRRRGRLQLRRLRSSNAARSGRRVPAA